MLAHSDGSQHDTMAIDVARLLVRFYNIVQEEDRYLSDAACDELPLLGQKLAVLYASLANISLRNGQRLWKMVPKLHLFVHLCEWVAPTYGNPSAYWCYADEDLVGKLIEVATSCHPKTLAETALLKWIHAYFIDV